MAALLYLLLFSCVSCLALFQTCVAQNATQLTETKPVSEHIEESLSDLESFPLPHQRKRSRACLELHGQHSRNLSTAERDAEADAGSREEGHSCLLRERQVRDYLDVATRTWRINNAVLEEIGNDLRLIIDCTDEGDVLLFDIRGTIKPPAQVTIPWNLTISAASESSEVVDGVYPRASRKTSFTCPNHGEGVFLIKSTSVLLANLKFENCSFSAAATSTAIVEVKECPSNVSTAAIQLHHVSFKRNKLIGAASLSARDATCSAIELFDFEFKNNKCGGQCGVVLTTRNELRNVTVRRVLPPGDGNDGAIVFYGPAGAHTEASNITAEHNEVGVFSIQSGFLRLESSHFSNNSFNASKANLHGACIFRANASAEIEGCTFEGNEAENGAVVSAERSNVTLNNSVLKKNRASRGGALYFVEVSVATVSNCSFVSNVALSSGGESGGGSLWSENGNLTVKNTTMRNCNSSRGGAMFLRSTNATLSGLQIFSSSAEDGGAIFVDSSKVEGERLTLEDNKADNAGGGIYIESAVRFSVTDSAFRRNEARSGGAVFARANSIGSFTTTTSEENATSENGSALQPNESAVTFRHSRFANGTAEKGGFVVVEGQVLVQIFHSAFINGAARKDGGCLQVDTGHLELRNVTLQNCTAQVDGGAMRLFSAFANITNVIMLWNRAEDDGGCLFAEKSNISVEGLIADGNSARDHAGALFIRSRTNLTVRDSAFKNTTADNGAIAFQEQNAVASFTNVSFINSAGFTEGGSFYIDDSETCLLNCAFENGVAENGGFLYAKRNSNITVVKTEMKNGTASHGGCLRAVDGRLNVSDSTFQSCSSTEDGGALHLVDMTVEISKTTFSTNHADYDGGAAFVSNTNLSGKGLTIYKNKAEGNGGGICFRDSTFSVTNPMFKRNSAVSGGAVHQSSLTNGKFMRAAFVSNNCTTSGGAILVDSSTLNIVESEFKTGEATLEGGFIAAVSNSSVKVEDAQMSGGQAAKGGAIAISESSFKGRNVTVSSCNATSTGGAFSIESGDAELHSALLKNCVIRNNTALFGGGVHVTSSNEESTCSDTKVNCTFVALLNTTFMNNNASQAGGGIFTGDLRNLRVDCLAQDEGAGVRKGGQGLSLDRLDSTKRDCTSWRDNSAGSYGEDVASFATRVVTNMSVNGNTNTVSPNQNPVPIRGYRSGKPLHIALKAEDDLGQSPAVGSNSRNVVTSVSSPDEFISANQGLVLATPIVNHSITGFVQPGNYRIRVEFDDHNLKTVEVEVEVHPCELGEVQSKATNSCEPCNAATYSIDRDPHKDKCLPCLENGNCTSRMMVPNDGYWHSGPCSEHIQRCPNADSCKRENRTRLLQNMTENMTSCENESLLIEDYTEVQCEEGYSGPLCASCNESHGKSHSFQCKECFSPFIEYTLVFLAFLVLLGLSSLTVKSNLISLVSLPQQLQLSRSSVASIEAHSVADGKKDVEMVAMDYGAKQVQDSGSEQEVNHSQDPRDPELAKWKAIELFKIIVNFLQVTAIAIAINVKWTLAMIAFFETAEFVSGITSEAVSRSIDCIASAASSGERAVVSILIDISQPPVAILVFAAFWSVITFRRKENWIYLMKKTVLSALVVFYMTYISINKTLLNILSCVDIYDSVDPSNDSTKSYWALDTSVKCHEEPHAFLANFLGWPFLIIFTLGFPLAVGCLIVKNVTDDYKEGWIYDISGFMYRSYRQKFVFWESVIMLRKALLAVVVVFAYPLGTNLQQVLTVFILILALYLQTMCRPYRLEFDVLNRMESSSILVSSLTFVSSLFFSDERVSHAVRVVVTLVVILGNIVLFVCLFGCFLTFAAGYLGSVLVREGVFYDPNRGPGHILKVYLCHYVLSRMKSRLLALFCRTNPNSYSRGFKV